jgi:hypothetical protein
VLKNTKSTHRSYLGYQYSIFLDCCIIYSKCLRRLSIHKKPPVSLYDPFKYFCVIQFYIFQTPVPTVAVTLFPLARLSVMQKFFTKTNQLPSSSTECIALNKECISCRSLKLCPTQFTNCTVTALLPFRIILVEVPPRDLKRIPSLLNCVLVIKERKQIVFVAKKERKLLVFL